MTSKRKWVSDVPKAPGWYWWRNKTDGHMGTAEIVIIDGYGVGIGAWSLVGHFTVNTHVYEWWPEPIKRPPEK